MRPIRFTIGSGMIVLSLTGVLVCLAGAVIVWTLRRRLEAVNSAALSAADELLVFADGRVDHLREALSTSRQRVSGIPRMAKRLEEEAGDVRKAGEPLL